MNPMRPSHDPLAAEVRGSVLLLGLAAAVAAVGTVVGELLAHVFG